MPPRSPIVSRLQAVTDSMAADMDDRYRQRLCQLVEREMNRRFRRREDPEDVVQSAFRTFYRRNAQGEFRIDFSTDLWRLLETITRHK
ncbi:MAG: LuxR family transcriptional regulator, partial [Thermoguttaceae bacterium]